jgi:hypothetical protein
MSKTVPTATAVRTDNLPNIKLPKRADDGCGCRHEKNEPCEMCGWPHHPPAAGAADQVTDDGHIARVGRQPGSMYLSSETRSKSCRDGSKREDSSQLTSYRRWIAVLLGTTGAGVTLAQCTAAPPALVARSSPSAAASSAASAPPAPAGGTVQPVTAAELGASWRPGCPVEPVQLRRVVDRRGAVEVGKWLLTSLSARPCTVPMTTGVPSRSRNFHRDGWGWTNRNL